MGVPYERGNPVRWVFLMSKAPLQSAYPAWNGRAVVLSFFTPQNNTKYRVQLNNWVFTANTSKVSRPSPNIRRGM